jgi:transcription antitermination factor NusG
MRFSMGTANSIESFGLHRPLLEDRCVTAPPTEKSWYAIYTIHHHEVSVLRHLDLRAIESFYPTYEVVRLWKNRQRIRMSVPLFPGYLFARSGDLDYRKVLQCPGVVRLVGNQCGPLPVADSVIELLRTSVAEKRVEPYRELAVGERVRVKSGLMRGVEGVLVRKDNAWRFVLTIESISQHVAIKVEAENLEPVACN